MEKLKSLVPDEIKQTIATSTSRDLLVATAALVDFLLPLQEFELTIKDLADPRRSLLGKNAGAAMELKHKGNRCYSDGNFDDALTYYSKAMRVAPLEAQDKEKDLISVLYVNRAAVLYKLDCPVECKRDCDRALRSSPSYAKAWFWRGKANAVLGNYRNASSELRIANFMEASSAGRKQIESQLLMISEKIGGEPSLNIGNTDGSSRKFNDKCEVELECVVTPDKGRGMVSKTEIPPSSLVHIEEPYAAVILKETRDSHCHYCFNELPADPIFCSSCSIPLYCSETCQTEAGGRISGSHRAVSEYHEQIPEELKEYIEDIILEKIHNKSLEQFQEHKLECSGTNWAAVLPSGLVLAGRIIAKAIHHKRDFLENRVPYEPLDLYYNYSELPPDIKLDLQIYSVALLCCLQRSDDVKIPVNAVSVSRTVMLMSQIRANCMAIVRMKSSDLQKPLREDSSRPGFYTSTIEQVKVGQAIYARGSLFNHSCKPNIHIYFISRNLFIRATEHIPGGHPLELSYGPQTGQWICEDRLKFLKEEYSFDCHCSGCSTLNLADITLDAFHCVNEDCNGVVLETTQVYSERKKIMHSESPMCPTVLEPYLQVENLNNLEDEMGENSSRENVGHCLKCKSRCNLSKSRGAVDKAWAKIVCLSDELVAGNVSKNSLDSASNSLHKLRLRLHPCNKRVAEAEDILAQAYCMIRDFQSALDHCSASLKILEKLYGSNHIVIGYELLKLLSVGIGNFASLEIADRVGNIFSCYYGSHVDILFPYMQSLRRELGKSVP